MWIIPGTGHNFVSNISRGQDWKPMTWDVGSGECLNFALICTGAPLFPPALFFSSSLNSRTIFSFYLGNNQRLKNPSLPPKLLASLSRLIETTLHQNSESSFCGEGTVDGPLVLHSVGCVLNRDVKWVGFCGCVLNICRLQSAAPQWAHSPLFPSLIVISPTAPLLSSYWNLD